MGGRYYSAARPTGEVTEVTELPDLPTKPRSQRRERRRARADGRGSRALRFLRFLRCFVSRSGTSVNSDVPFGACALSSDLPQRAHDAARLTALEAHDAADDVVACRKGAEGQRAAGDDTTGAGAREGERQGDQRRAVDIARQFRAAPKAAGPRCPRRCRSRQSRSARLRIRAAASCCRRAIRRASASQARAGRRSQVRPRSFPPSRLRGRCRRLPRHADDRCRGQSPSRRAADAPRRPWQTSATRPVHLLPRQGRPQR